MEIQLEILEEEILLDNYDISKRCPITKALHRAGYPNYFEVGGYIEHKTSDNGRGTLIAKRRGNDSYIDLVVKLFGMYNSFSSELHTLTDSYGREIAPKAIPVTSFKHTLTF